MPRLCDASEVHELTRAALKSLERNPRVMKTTLDRAARQERARHKYQNRTFNLQDSTFATELREGPNEFSVELGARTFYAEFVNRRGLMQIDERAQEAATELDFYFDGEAEKLSRM